MSHNDLQASTRPVPVHPPPSQRGHDVADQLRLIHAYQEEVTSSPFSHDALELASLWLVGGRKAAERLTQRGVPRWCMWTLGEVQELLAAFGTSVGSLAEAAEALRRTPE